MSCFIYLVCCCCSLERGSEGKITLAPNFIATALESFVALKVRIFDEVVERDARNWEEERKGGAHGWKREQLPNRESEPFFSTPLFRSLILAKKPPWCWLEWKKPLRFLFGSARSLSGYIIIKIVPHVTY